MSELPYDSVVQAPKLRRNFNGIGQQKTDQGKSHQRNSVSYVDPVLATPVPMRTNETEPTDMETHHVKSMQQIHLNYPSIPSIKTGRTGRLENSLSLCSLSGRSHIQNRIGVNRARKITPQAYTDNSVAVVSDKLKITRLVKREPYISAN